MIKLHSIPTGPPAQLSRDDIEKETKDLAERFGALQRKLYAGKEYAVLILFQGMDASGKDGASKHAFADCHPQGVNIFSFKKPTEEELSHDFLWRVHKVVPPKGMIHVFNRSHYEDILIQRVHGWIDEQTVTKRMQAINAFEELLAADNQTLIFKFYLHISFEQQAIELQERLDEPDKHWKHNPNDWKEREHWEQYMAAYEYAINESRIPWVITPVDKRWYRNYIVLKTLVEKLEGLNMAYPPLPL
ncbi:PPK2 family polyphosphate kinase [Phaeodactylibacter luteus]|uniref:Polyphosphate kinase n=1 Tax=Phaeodactylibacter luteus TaxID=1564516 RepID=A0A5C6S7A2_9BACT|nr:PPK2 family polyphosphate kinase [Phaeodactylibacter luteus]TXB69524.1 polyphosphate kinase [Phaeodactylibacter luteus]